AVDVSQARAAAPVVVSCLVLRSGGESSAERSVRLALAEQPVEALPRQAPEALRLSLRRSAVLRLEELRAQLRPGGLLRFRHEVVVRPRQLVAARQRRPALQLAPRQPAAAGEEAAEPRPAALTW